jgi:type III secretion protein C
VSTVTLLSSSVRVALLGLCIIGGTAHSAELPFANKRISFAAVEPKDLRMFLQEFAVQQGVAISIDPEVKGELTGRYELPPRSMLELLGRTFGLIWYYDGRVLYIQPASAVESAVLRLGDTTPQRFERTLSRLGITDRRFPLSYDSERGTAMVSGPRRFVELVKQAANSGERPTEVQDPTTAVRIYALKYGFANDYQVASGSRESVVPGVVTILRQAYTGEGQGSGSVSGRRVGISERRALDSSDSTASSPNLPELDAPRGRQQRVSEDTSPVRRVSTAQGVPSFSADPRTNTVIVRDIPARIDQYEALIKRLDERPRLVEIEANIVEVNADDFFTLGIDWRLSGRRGSVEVGGGGLADPVVRPGGLPPAVAGAAPLNPLGNVAGMVVDLVAGNRTQLFARLSALEQDGKAAVRAQPKVMTLNNVEAALDATSTFYVPVQGFQDAQLFDVTAGTSIRITPSVVTPADMAADGAPLPGKDQIRLLIRIEDGGLTQQVVGQLPVVNRTTITTQSIVADGQTLLIAGYSQERETSTKNGVPVLGRMPVIGPLFNSQQKNFARVERLFMITPRVIELEASAAAPRPHGN